MLLLDDERLESFRAILDKEEVRVYDLLNEIFSGKQTYRDLQVCFGRIEGFLAIYWFVNRLTLTAKKNVNWQYSTGEILGELCERVRGTAHLRPGENFYDGLGVLHRVCSCGSTFPAGKSEWCPECRELRRRNEMIRKIEKFIKKRKLMGGGR